MFDLRPAGYVIGMLVAVIGALMLLPMALDFLDGSQNWVAMGLSAFVSIFAGGLIALSCANSDRSRLSIPQTFFLTTGVWFVLPIFGAVPFLLGVTDARIVDAFFEAMSGYTTTGATVFSELDMMPRGLLLWRGMMQWIGGIGVIVVAMVFLPVLRVGGMQIFRSEGFDTFGKILPRAAEISWSISVVYVILTVMCFIGYSMAGLGVFDAGVHAMTTLATGGFANYDASFSNLGAGVEYVGAAFMLLASLPFVRYVQLIRGDAEPLYRDSQIQSFFICALGVVLALTIWQLTFVTDLEEQAFRKALFNGVSILTGTGYASDDYQLWGGFAVTLFFMIGLIGGCAGSTTCSIKVFRYQLLFAAITAQIRQIASPNGVFDLRYERRRVAEDVLNSVIAFFMLFMLTLAVVAVALGMTGVDLMTSVSGAAAALANIGPGLGPEIGPSGNYAGLNDAAKWILALAMLIGRLEIMAVFVLFTATFWRG